MRPVVYIGAYGGPLVTVIVAAETGENVTILNMTWGGRGPLTSILYIDLSTDVAYMTFLGVHCTIAGYNEGSG